MATSRQVLLQSLERLMQLLVVVSALVLPSYTACYTSIFSFGDSFADTGNLYYSSSGRFHCFFPPNGATYFHHPTGRCSNGRLVVDFIAESLGLPLLNPYLGIKNVKLENRNIEQGVNFAVVGATALDSSFFQEREIYIPTNLSLSVQLEWFKELLPTLCNSSSSCKSLFRKSLILMGEIGGNDFNYFLAQQMSMQEIETYVPDVIKAITSAIKELIDLGAVTLIVPGNFPLGCFPICLTLHRPPRKEEYDEAGCIKWLNKFAQYYNRQLQTALDQLQMLYPHTHIIYADYFNATSGFYHAPKQYGFTGSALKACCGGGGPYNYNSSAECGFAGAEACEDPSKYVSWDGIHLTEAAYNWLARGLLYGPYTKPKINESCFSNKLTPTTSVFLQ